MARKNAYDTIIKPAFDYIGKQIKNGAEEKQVCKAIGISEDTWYKYKASKPEFAELIKNNRQLLVTDLRGALVKKAFGYNYEEEKMYKTIDKDGNEVVKVEKYRKHLPPDVAAINLCLKNYDKENWSNDPRADDFRREELELKRLKLDSEVW